jgi:hypothetical protein
MEQQSLDPSVIGSRWVWVLDVVFGGVLSVAFTVLEESLRQAWAESHVEAARLVFVAVCLFSFFVYDVVAYHLLITKYPYRVSLLSGVRHFLDMFMVFVLLKLLMSGLRPHAEKSFFAILAAVTAWHLLALVWHCVANLDHFKKMPPRFALLPHVVCPACYWTVLGAWSVIAGFIKDGAYNTEQSYILLLAAMVLSAALFRSRQLVRKLVKADPEAKERAPKMMPQPVEA